MERPKELHYAILTREAQDSIKDPLAIVVYLTLQRFMDYQTGLTWVSDARAAKEARMSVRTFIRKKQLLKKLGWVTWQNRQGTTNLCSIVVNLGNKVIGVSNNDTGIGHTDRGDMTQSHTPLCHSVTQSNYSISNYKDQTIKDRTINNELAKENFTGESKEPMSEPLEKQTIVGFWQNVIKSGKWYSKDEIHNAWEDVGNGQPFKDWVIDNIPETVINKFWP